MQRRTSFAFLQHLFLLKEQGLSLPLSSKKEEGSETVLHFF